MRQVCARSTSIIVLVVTLIATAPAALATESDAKAGKTDAETAKAEPSPKAAESAPNQVCEPSKDTAEFNTLEDLYVGAAADLLSLIASVPGKGVRDASSDTAAEVETPIVWHVTPRD